MSKLNIVKSALESNPNVVIIMSDEYRENLFPYRVKFPNGIDQGYNILSGQFFDFRVAPKNGLYTLAELQSFMLGLVPALEPTARDDFRQYQSMFWCGGLRFEEIIGYEKVSTKRIQTLTDEGLLGAYKSFVDGKRIVDAEDTIMYARGILVGVYPDKEFAQDVCEGKIKESNPVSLKELKRYQHGRGLLQRIFG